MPNGRNIRLRRRIWTVLLLLSGTAAAWAQVQPQPVRQPNNRDWEYPPHVRRIMALDPTAFEFKYAHFSITEEVKRTRTAIARGLMTAASAKAMGKSAEVTGTFNYPVIVGTFLNTRDDTTLSLSEFEDRLFQSGYTGGGHTGSLRDYYYEVSGHRVVMQGDVIGYADADSAVDYYRNTGTNPGLGKHREWIVEVIEEVDAAVDFSQYDSDSDGFVDVLILAHNMRGYECNVGSDFKGFWSHRSYLPDPYYTTNDGVKIADYVMQPLKGCDGLMNGIGVFAHEMGHAFGLPDLYDWDDEGSGGDSRGLGYWALMSNGNWNRPESPAHMCLWSKLELGWIDSLLVITDADYEALEIPELNTHRFAIKIHTPQMNPLEYFLIGNRQSVGFDKFLPGNGLLIYHINDQVTTQNLNPLDKRWVLEQADGLFHLEQDPSSGQGNLGDAGDPWPGTTNKTHFWFDGIPDSRTRDGLDSYVDITLLTGSQDTMKVDLFATEAFLLTAPEAGVYVKDATPLLDWEDYAAPASWGTLSYRIEIDTLSTFATAVFDTASASQLEWTGSLTENVTYFWRVRAFDDLGHSRVNNGGPGTFVLDATAPVLTIGAFRNPVLDDRIDLLLVSNETLNNSSLTADGTTLTLLPVTATTAFIRRADLTVSSAGTIALHAEGSDAAGNTGSSDATLSIAFVSAGAATSLKSADGRFTVHIPAGSVWREQTALLLQGPEPETELSPSYWLDIPDRVPGRKVLVTIEWPAGAFDRGEVPVIWRKAGGEWTALSTAVDLSARTASVQVEELGVFQLREGGAGVSLQQGPLELRPAYPNPFNPSTRIEFTLPEPGLIRLTVLNTRGQTVRVLAEGNHAAGRHQVTWDGRDSAGNRAATGIYLYVLETPWGVRSRKMTLIR